jgi:hypothetical protein
MATEYDLLRSLLSRSDQHNERTVRPIDKHVNITKLLSLLRRTRSSLGIMRRRRDHRRAS